MAMAMAPGLSGIVVFEGNATNFIPNDILGAMAASNTIKNLSCSWTWSGGPSTTTETLFKNMASYGQSFFQASGDTDAFVAGSNNDVDNSLQIHAPVKFSLHHAGRGHRIDHERDGCVLCLGDGLE